MTEGLSGTAVPPTANPYPQGPYRYDVGEEWRAEELCALLAAREAGDRAWLRQAVLSSGGDESMLCQHVEALPLLWEWVLHQVDLRAPVVPDGWHREWGTPPPAAGEGRDAARVGFLGQAMVLHLVSMFRHDRPELSWVPYRPKMAARDPWFLVPTVADTHGQLFPTIALSIAVVNAAPWLDGNTATATAVLHDPHYLQREATRLAVNRPFPRGHKAGRANQSAVADVGRTGRVQPLPTSEENPREVYLFRAKNLLDGVDPADCSPIDPQRLPAGLRAMGFEEMDQDEPLEPEDGMLLSEWTLDRPDGTAVAYALVMASPAGKWRRGGVRKVELRIETEADEDMTAAERASGTWWHAGVIAGLRKLAEDLGARVVSREELENAEDPTR